MIMNYMPEVRDRILSRLAEQKPDYVQTVEGRNALVQLLTQDLEAPYLPQPRGPLINGVLFTAFVLQYMSYQSLLSLVEVAALQFVRPSFWSIVFHSVFISVVFLSFITLIFFFLFFYLFFFFFFFF